MTTPSAHPGPRRCAAATAALLLALAAPAQALSTLVFSIEETGSAATQQTVHIKGGSLLVRGAGGDPNVDIFYQAADQTLNVVNHGERSIMPLDEARVAQFASQAGGVMSAVQQQLAQQMAGMSEEEQAQFKAMLNQFGAGAAAEAPKPPPKISTVNKGVTRVNGFECVLTEIRSGGTPVTRLCAAKPGALGIDAGDRQTVRSLLNTANRLRVHAASMARQFGAHIPEFGEFNLDHVPIAMDQGAMRMRLVKVEAASPDLALPSGYAIRELPSLTP